LILDLAIVAGYGSTSYGKSKPALGAIHENQLGRMLTS